jgi:hypothetical protein
MYCISLEEYLELRGLRRGLALRSPVIQSSANGGAAAVRDVLVMSGAGTNVLRICVQICRHVDVWCSYHPC